MKKKTLSSQRRLGSSFLTSHFFVIVGISLVLILVSCGPMNKKLEGLNSNTSPFVKPGESKNLSKNAQFYIYTSLSHSQPVLGDNEVTMRFVYANTLLSLSNKAKTTVVYSMPEMPQMGEVEENAVLQPDGTFLATLFFSMAGRWHIVLKIEDGSVQDEYDFEIDL